MYCIIVQRGPTGEPDILARIPLQSGQPLMGDKIRLTVDDFYIIFQVVDREWNFEQNVDGGGMIARLTIVVTQVNAVRKPEPSQRPTEATSAPAGPPDEPFRAPVRPIKDSPQA